MPKIYTPETWTDELLSGAERYNISDNVGVPIESNVQINLASSVAIAGTLLTADRMNNIEGGIDQLDTIVADHLDLLTTGGSSTAYTITTIGESDLVTGESFKVKFHATAGATPTLNRDSKGAKSIKYYDATGAKQSAGASSIIADMICDVVYDGVDYVILDALAGNQRESDYLITPTVVNNDLVLTVTHADGTTPSASRPLWFYIGHTWRACVAALSVTKTDNTNWANLGSAELGTVAQDLFPYVIWNTNLSSGTVDIAWSRIPWGRLYSDFSGTTTNEKYLAINATAPAATDECKNIGRFEATLSLAATNHVWTVPASYTNINLVNEPSNRTRVVSYTPVPTRATTPYTNLPTINNAKYQVVDRRIVGVVRLTQNGTPGGSGAQQFTLPFSPTNAFQPGGLAANESTGITLLCFVISPNILRQLLYDATAQVTASQVYHVSFDLPIG